MINPRNTPTPRPTHIKRVNGKPFVPFLWESQTDLHYADAEKVEAALKVLDERQTARRLTDLERLGIIKSVRRDARMDADSRWIRRRTFLGFCGVMAVYGTSTLITIGFCSAVAWAALKFLHII